MSNEWSPWGYNQYELNHATTTATGGQSTWGRYQKALRTNKWPHFPNPFPWIKNVQVLSCSPNILVKVELATEMFGNWFVSSFVPQPSEIVRKFLTGKMKHGYFFLPEELTNVSLPFIGETSKAFLAEIAGPVTTGFYYMWLAQTSISFVNVFESLPLLFAGCPGNTDDTYLANGHATFTGDPFDGAAVFYSVISDPHNRYQDPSAVVVVPQGHVNSYAAGKIFANGAHIQNCKVYFGGATIPKTEFDVGEISPGGVADFSMGWGYNLPFTYGLSVNVEGNIVNHPVGLPEIQVTRWVTNTSPIDTFPNNDPRKQTPHPCMAPNQPLLSMA